MAFSLESITSGKRRVAPRLFLYGPHGIGKALAHGTLVLTPAGFISVESISKGDSVMAVDGTATEVIGVYPQQPKQLYRVTFDDGSFVDCCGEHLWKVYSLLDRRDQRDGTVISTERMIQTLYAGKKYRTLNYSIPMTDPVQFEAKPVLADPYVIGAWLGDGSKGSPVISKPYSEFQAEILKIYPNSTNHDQGKGLYVVDIRNALIEYGIFNLGSHERFVPDSLKYNTPEVRLSVLQGLLDTDGYTSTVGAVIYTTTSPKLRDDVVFLVQSFGGIATVGNKKPFYIDDSGERVQCKDAYNVYISIADMGNLFRADLMKGRRSKQYTTRPYRDCARFIKRIDPIGIGESTCLRVAHPSRLFVIKDFIVTHNTTWAASAPKPIVIQTEDGLGLLEAPAFPLATASAQVHEAISALYYEAHDFQTVILDSADWLDNLIGTEIRANHSEKELAYGKDMVLIAEQWRQVLEGFNALRTKNMTVIFTGHCEIKRFDPPDSDSYERYQPKMTSRASALIQEWADCVLLAGFKTFVKKEVVANASAKTPTTKSKPMANAERLLYTGEKPAHLAKNRFNLPPELPLVWADFEAALTASMA